MRRYYMLLLIGALLLIAAPLQAQVPTPPVPAPSAQEIQWLGQVLNYAQQTGQSDASTVNTAVVLIAVFMVIMVLAFLVGVRAISKPAVSVVANLQERANKAEEERITQQREHERELAALNKERAQFAAKTAQSLDQFAASQMRMLEMFESKSDAEKGREGAVEAINKHTTEDGEKTRAALKEVADQVNRTADVVEKAATVVALNSALDTALEPVRQQVAQLQVTLNEVARRIGSDPLDPAKVPEADPAAKPEDASSSTLTPGVPR